MPCAKSCMKIENPSRYLLQLCRHAEKVAPVLRHLHDQAGQGRPEVLEVRWTDSTGTLRLSSGTCTLHAEGNTLTVHIDAIDETHLRRTQDIITADLERFGRREHLRPTWSRPAEPPSD